MSIVLLFITGIIFALITYRGSIKNSLQKIYSKSYLAVQLFMLYLKVKKNTCSIDTKEFIKLKYVYQNREYMLLFPFDMTKVNKMKNLKVTLHSNDKQIDITQQPGVPYLLSANQLDGEYITVTNGINTITYDGETIPEFCDKFQFVEYDE